MFPKGFAGEGGGGGGQRQPAMVQGSPHGPVFDQSPMAPPRCVWGTVGSRLRVQGSGFRVQGSGFRVQGSGFRVRGSGFRVQGSGCRFRV